MNEAILELIKGLKNITEKAKIKWSEGSSEDEYFLNFEGKGIVIAKSSNSDIEYILRFLRPDGGVQFAIQLSANDGELFKETESLYNVITTKSPEASLTIEELLKLVKAKDEEK